MTKGEFKEVARVFYKSPRATTKEKKHDSVQEALSPCTTGGSSAG